MIPPMTLAAINTWLEHGTHPTDLGSFVRALLTNDLRSAVSNADVENLASLADTIRWIYWNVPSGAYGSLDTLLAYHDLRRADRERGAA